MIAGANVPFLGGEGVLGEDVLGQAVRDEGVLNGSVSDEAVFDEGVRDEAVLGVGTDLVDVAQFATQLETTGSTFGSPGVFFTSRELRRARERALEKGDSVAEHLAAIWALKEAAIKAWVSALERSGTSLPLTPEQVKWSQITITHSASGAPRLRLVREMAEVFDQDFGAKSPRAPGARDPHGGRAELSTRATRNSQGAAGTDSTRQPGADGTRSPGTPTWHVSASHDGAYAVGFVVLAH